MPSPFSARGPPGQLSCRRRSMLSSPAPTRRTQKRTSGNQGIRTAASQATGGHACASTWAAATSTPSSRISWRRRPPRRYFTAEAGTAFIHDNRIRSRFPGGETAFVGGVAESCVTGNVVANEAEHEGESRRSRNMGLFPATEPPEVVITGNVFIRPQRSQGRSRPRAFNSWDPLNTVIP